jgi:hypothetical protein
MPRLELNLDQIFHLLEQLSPEELAKVQEWLAARRRAAQVPSPPAWELPSLAFDRYLALPDAERELLQLRAYRVNRARILSELETRRAGWLLVCNGEVLSASPSLQESPSRERLLQIGRERGQVPFLFAREPPAGEAL